MQPVAVVVLAAGAGTRMKSAATPKVLFAFAGRSMLGHVIAALDPLDAVHTLVVVGHERAAVSAHLAAIAPAARPVVQQDQRGTGHAVRTALQAIDPVPGVVVVVPGDAPLLRPDTMRHLLGTHEHSGAAATLLTSRLADPTDYGRVIRGVDGSVLRVVEQRDADQAELEVDEVATSVYVFDHALLRAALGRLGTDNAQGEEYLPDVIAILRGDGHVVGAVSAPPHETAGVNDRVQLAAAHGTLNRHLVEAHMRAGVTVTDPATTWIDVDIVIEPDATLLPCVDLHGATRIGAGALVGPQVSLTDTTVGAGSRIDRAVCEGASIGSECLIGPFAYLRPGSVLADGVKIGTYVEVKGSDIGTGSKVPHLSYVGDASIGAHTNIGAATVFVNYDGVQKRRSTIGSHARTGADTMFVAPVSVGDGAYTAAGSVIVHDVPPGALAVSRARQRNVAGWVARKRAGTDAARAAESSIASAAERPEPTVAGEAE